MTEPTVRRRAVKAPADRKPPTRKTAARKPTADLGKLRAELEAGELAEMPAARVETLGELEPGEVDLPDDGSVRVVVNGNTFDVRSPADWRASAQEALAQGLFNTWARSALYPDSAALWMELDPTNRECVAFMDAYDEAARLRFGDDPKATQRQLGLSRSTRRR